MQRMVNGHMLYVLIVQLEQSTKPKYPNLLPMQIFSDKVFYSRKQTLVNLYNVIWATKLDVRFVQPYCTDVSEMFVDITNNLSFAHYTDCFQLKQNRSLSRPTLDKL